MNEFRRPRPGLSLLEVLVVVALIALLLGLLLPGVQKVRDAALRTQSSNHLKQVALATQDFAGDWEGRLPPLSGVIVPTDVNHGGSLFLLLLPYIEQGNLYTAYKLRYPDGQFGTEFTVRAFLNPADPSLAGGVDGKASYAANGEVFGGRPRLEQVSDGLSNTVMFAQHYAGNCNGTDFDWALAFPFPLPPNQHGTTMLRTPSFADRRSADVVPVTTGDPPVSGPSVPTLTFQTRPTIRDCDPRLAQSPHAGGMPVAMCDGSVRILAASMSPETYWAAVTRDAGETFGNDW